MTGLSLPLTRRPGRARDNIIPGFAVFGPKSIPLEMEVRYGSYSVDSVDGWREVRRSQITHHRATEQGPQLQILTAPVSRSAGARGYPALLPSASKSLCPRPQWGCATRRAVAQRPGDHIVWFRPGRERGTARRWGGPRLCDSRSRVL